MTFQYDPDKRMAYEHEPDTFKISVNRTEMSFDERPIFYFFYFHSVLF